MLLGLARGFTKAVMNEFDEAGSAPFPGTGVLVSFARFKFPESSPFRCIGPFRLRDNGTWQFTHLALRHQPLKISH